MTSRRRTTPGPKPQRKLRSRDIGGAKYLRSATELLRPLRPHKDCPNRRLHFDEYVAYLLLYFFNPIVTSLRGLQQVSTLDKVRRKLKLPRFSLGSFSEARNVFDPSLLEPLIAALVDEVAEAGADPRLAALDVAATVVDGTPIHALPKMAWALWRDGTHRAAKVHLEYSLLLATDQLDLDAELVADLYRYRWQIELFFRWFKT
ncbi:transposase, partial [bacterium]|nr:transposase [bacterium]